MKIKTLSDVKREMTNKRPFYIVNHRVERFIGQIRIPNVIQTNGIYTHTNNPDDEISHANNNKGIWFEYGKAKNWNIDDLTGHCEIYLNENHTKENFIMEFVFFNDKFN